MIEIKEADIRELEPYSDEEVPAALARLLTSPALEQVRASYFASVSPEQFAGVIRSIRTSAEFQAKIIAPAIEAMLASSSGGFTLSGLSNLERKGRYTFISNHRDITCDPALFTFGLFREGFESPLICLGENLLTNPWVTDLIKVNRGVTVKRGLSQRELLRWSQTLSFLLNRAVRDDRASVWIAQREGRAKDGNDQTHSGVIKMLTLSRDESVVEKARALRVVPLSISYEYDPCDAMKARELHYTQLHGSYQKRPGEDELSMALGIRGHKGRIHLTIGTEIRETLAKASQLTRREQVDSIVAGLDQQIHSNYRLWPSNYVASDLLEGSDRNRRRYTDEERDFFIDRMESQLDRLKESLEARDSLRARFLEIYANPVRNAAKALSEVSTQSDAVASAERTRRMAESVPAELS